MNSKISRALAALADAGRAIAKVRSIQAVKEVHDAAEAQVAAAKRAALPADVQHVLAEVSLRAARRAGELLTETPLSRGGRPGKEEAAKQAKTLRDLGLNKNQSWRWRRLATIPQALFDAYLTEARELGKPPSAAKLLRLAAELNRSRRARRPNEAPGPVMSHEPTVSAGAAPPEYADDLGELHDHLEHFGDLFGSLVAHPDQAHPPAMRRHAATVLKEIREIVVKLRRLSA